MAYICTRFHVPYVSDSLVIAIKPEMKESFHMTAVLLLQQTLPQLSFIFFQVMLQYIIEGAIK
jgi:hypothetical protein